MIIHDCIQGSKDWLSLRAGIPTASVFSEIVTPGGKLSKSSDRLMYSLLAERVLGQPLTEHVSAWMERGTSFESEAVEYYEFQRDCETEKVGFITNDAGTIGASPDRLAGPKGLVEIKCPSAAIHMSYLLGKTGVDEKYKPQVQGQLWITEREFADAVSYHPHLPFALVRATRDEEFIKLLISAVTYFSDTLEEMALKLKADGIIKTATEPEYIDPLGITDEDVEMLMRDRFPEGVAI